MSKGSDRTASFELNKQYSLSKNDSEDLWSQAHICNEFPDSSESTVHCTQDLTFGANTNIERSIDGNVKTSITGVGLSGNTNQQGSFIQLEATDKASSVIKSRDQSIAETVDPKNRFSPSSRAQFDALILLTLSIFIALFLIINSVLRTVMKTPLSRFLELSLSMIFPLVTFFIVRRSKKPSLVFLFALACGVAITEFFGGALAANDMVAFARLPVKDQGCHDVDRLKTLDARYEKQCKEHFKILLILCASSTVTFFLSLVHARQCYKVILQCNIRHQYRGRRINSIKGPVNQTSRLSRDIHPKASV